jgi:Gram-negative porin
MNKTPVPTRLLRALFGLSAALATAGAQADDSMFSISGFGTVGLVKTDTDKAEYVISGQPNGATKKASAEVDSKIAVQLGAKFSSMFSATAQVMSRQNGEGSFKPRVEWAFLKGQLTPAVAVRAGRMGAPLFAVSDFRNVGYANTWLRPPQEVYGQVSFSSFDGADVGYSTSFGDASLNVQGFGGSTKDTTDRVDLEVKKLVGVNATLDLGNGLTLRVGHAQGKLTVKSASIAGLVGLLRQTPFAAVGNEMIATDKDATFSGLGLNYDEGNWVVSSEYTKRKTDSFVTDTTGWFITVGHRFGKFTPYATLSELKRDSTNVNNTIPPGVAIPNVTANLQALVNGALASQRSEQKTGALGVRWDAYRNVAVKAQLERISPRGDGLFIAKVPGWGSERVNVLSVAVDFVF